MILKDERAQRILHEFLVDGKTILEIAEEHLISTNRARQIKIRPKASCVDLFMKPGTSLLQ